MCVCVCVCTCIFATHTNANDARLPLKKEDQPKVFLLGRKTS